VDEIFSIHIRVKPTNTLYSEKCSASQASPPLLPLFRSCHLSYTRHNRAHGQLTTCARHVLSTGVQADTAQAAASVPSWSRVVAGKLDLLVGLHRRLELERSHMSARLAQLPHGR
jgi:hypothetical protein